jgi:hypothetical protein
MRRLFPIGGQWARGRDGRRGLVAWFAFAGIVARERRTHARPNRLHDPTPGTAVIGPSIADVLPLAVGVAVSPLPIIAVILMLISPGAYERARVPAGLDRQLGRAQRDRLRDLERRRRVGKQQRVRRHLDRQDGARRRAGADGIPRVAEASGARRGLADVLAVFVVVASLSVVAPVAVDLLAGDRAQHVLNSWKGWLEQNNATVMAVVLVLIGVVLFAKGLGPLTS